MLAEADALLAGTDGLDLALFPEAALTGYVSPTGNFDRGPYAEPLEGPSAERLAELAQRHRVYIAGPLIERAGALLYNSLLLFDRAGRRVGHWRKRHPWFPEIWAAPGDLGSPIVTIENLRITAAICYDLHFLPDDAATTLASAELLLFPSAWVEEPPESRFTLLPALARQFDLAIVNANWGPGAPRIPGQGRSILYRADGSVAARARLDAAPQIIIATTLR